jgi:hypothetical protein
MTFAPINTISSFLPTEFQIEGDEKFVRQLIAERERLTASIINVKENSNYEKSELLSGQQWFTSNIGGQLNPEFGYRLSFDLVALNGGNIPNGTTTINLPTTATATNIPIVITYVNSLIPTHGFGAATIGTTLYFINDPQIYVRFTNTNPTTQSVVVTNTTGLAITQFYWVFEYLKT